MFDVYYGEAINDAPIAHMVELARALATHSEVVFVTSRSERSRPTTIHWLKRHVAMPEQGTERDQQVQVDRPERRHLPATFIHSCHE